MKILYFYQYFSTPQGCWGTRVYEFAKEWVDQQHEVVIVTSIYSKSDLTAVKLIEKQYFDGIKVIVLNIFIDNKQTLKKRAIAFIKYSLLSSYYALTQSADVVVASSGPISIGVPALIARYVRRRKLIFETRDLWPQGAVELGVIQNNLIQRMAYWLEKKCYAASSYVITLSPGMTQNIQRRFGLTNIIDVTNAANITLFSEKRNFFDSFLISKEYAVYTGNIGEVNNSILLFKAAKELMKVGRGDIKIVLIGDGQQSRELENKAKQELVSNFIILGLMSKTKLVAYLQNAFVSLVPFSRARVLDTSSPNKFFESLAAGIPVIQTTQGWIKNFIEEHGVGITVESDDPKILAQTLIYMRDNPDDVARMSKRASEVAKKYFDKHHLANKMLDIIKKVHDGDN